VSRTETQNEPLLASALNLRQATTVAVPWRQPSRHLDLKRQLFVGGQWLQCAANGLRNVLNAVIGQFENELPGLDF
jgi:hypothetical protein